jgi:hypothetical protein
MNEEEISAYWRGRDDEAESLEGMFYNFPLGLILGFGLGVVTSALVTAFVFA